MIALDPADYMAINQVIAMLTYAVDAHEPERWLACWSREPRLVVDVVGKEPKESTGRDALRATVDAWRTRDPSQVHQIGLITVIEDGEGWVKTTHSAQLFRMSGTGTRLAAFAHYHDHLVRESDSWRMHDRHVRIRFADA